MIKEKWEMRAIVIGRHAPDFGAENIEVVETRNIQFPPDSDGCFSVMSDICGEATRRGINAVVLQMVPGQLAVALARFYGSESYITPIGRWSR